MRILAIGDIHGCSRALDALLNAVEPGSDDTVVTLGDYVDRGPDVRGVLDRLLALRQRVGTLVTLRGNHEQMMQAARDGLDRRMWLACGGRETLASYGARGGDDADFARVPAAHWRLLDDCCDWYETGSHFFVHANAYPDMDLSDQPDYMLLWQPLNEPVRHCSGKTMVCGHTRQRSGRPLYLGTSICIDTGAYDRDGWLTCLDVRSYRLWQANQAGEVRTGWLGACEEEAED